MTTQAETLATAITDAAHILASAIRAHTPHQTDKTASTAENRAEVASVDPEGAEGAQNATERAANPRPMTVGQLTAEHIGKRVTVGHSHPGASKWDLVLEQVTHSPFLAELTSDDGVLRPKRPDTPCEVLDD